MRVLYLAYFLAAAPIVNVCPTEQVCAEVCEGDEECFDACMADDDECAALGILKLPCGEDLCGEAP